MALRDMQGDEETRIVPVHQSAVCRCGHTAGAHACYLSRTDCAICGTCPRFAPRRRQGRLRAVLSALRRACSPFPPRDPGRRRHAAR